MPARSLGFAGSGAAGAPMDPGRKAGAVAVFGVTADRNGPTDFPVLRASRRIVDCSGSAGAQAMSAGRVIKSNAEFLDAGTSAGGA